MDQFYGIPAILPLPHGPQGDEDVLRWAQEIHRILYDSYIPQADRIENMVMVGESFTTRPDPIGSRRYFFDRTLSNLWLDVLTESGAEWVLIMGPGGEDEEPPAAPVLPPDLFAHLTDYDNPHQVTAEQLGLADSYLLRTADDFTTFDLKATIGASDVFLIEDAADSYNKKKVTLGSGLPPPTLDDSAVTLNIYNGSGGDFDKGEIVYISGDQSGTPSCTKAQADTEANCNKMIVMCAENILNGNSGLGTIYGVVDGFTGKTAGALQYLDPDTAGLITETIPSTSGDLVRILGYAISTTEVFFNPDGTYLEIA